MARSPIALCVVALTLSSVALAGCSSGSSAQGVQVSVIATTDLHGAVTYDITQYIERERKVDPQVTVVDAGDFFDADIFGAMAEYFAHRSDEAPAAAPAEIPVVRQLADAGYDAAVLGNHEFVANDMADLDDVVGQLTSGGVDVLSANTYRADGSSYVRPYVVREIATGQGAVRLGILGLTVKEVGEEGPEDTTASRELADMAGYDGALYMADLIEDAEKWVTVMTETEHVDAIVAVVHSGERPKNPKHPGNRIQELARQVSGIDAIVAGHTHKLVEQHDYTSPTGENVIVTQPGAHGRGVSKITLELEGKPGAWRVVDRTASLTRMPADNTEEDLGAFLTAIHGLDEGAEVSLGEALSFDWDTAYAATAGATNEDLYRAVGYPWKDLPQVRSEGLVEIVFMNDGRVECYLRMEKAGFGIGLVLDDADGRVVELRPGKNDTFTVEYTPAPELPSGQLMTLRQQ